MNVLIIQQNPEHDKNRIYQESYCLQRAFNTFSGFSTEIWGIGRSNYKYVPDFNKYDIILLLEQRRFDYVMPHLGAIKASKAFKALFAIDTHSLGIEPFNYIKDLGGFNYILCAIKHHMTKDSMWFPNWHDSFLMKPLRVDNRSFIGFCGHGGGEKRENLLKLVESYNPDFIFDNSVIGDEMVKSINSYQLHFNYNVLDDINFRNFETIGMGVPLITNYNYQYEELGFIEGENIVFYRSDYELLDKITYYRNNIDELLKIGKGGLELSKKHSCLARVTQLLKHV